jgi:hypothetical protein
VTDHLPTVELVTRSLPAGPDPGSRAYVDYPCELVEAVRVGSGPRLEVPLGSRVTVEHAAGEGPPTVRVELLAARVRYVDREAVPEPPPAGDHGVALHHLGCADCLEVARALCLAADREHRAGRRAGSAPAPPPRLPAPGEPG